MAQESQKDFSLRKCYYNSFSGILDPADALNSQGFGRGYSGFSLLHPGEDRHIGYVSYRHTKYWPVDDKHFVAPIYDFAPGILRQTPERAIVDCIRMFDEVDHGLFFDGLEDYIYDFPDLTKLYEVAEFYNVSRETIDEYIAQL